MEILEAQSHTLRGFWESLGSEAVSKRRQFSFLFVNMKCSLSHFFVTWFLVVVHEYEIKCNAEGLYCGNV